MIIHERGRKVGVTVLTLVALLYISFFLIQPKLTGNVISNYPEIASIINEQGETRVIIQFNDNPSVQIDDLSDDFKLIHLLRENAVAGIINKAGLEKLQSNPAVKSIDVDEKVYVFLNDSAQLINATSVWSKQVNGFNLTGLGQTVCILDTGINYSHAALANVYVGGFDFISNDTDPYDDQGHGTIMAGIIASQDSVYRGIAYGAKVAAVKVLDASGSGYSSDVIAGIDWCSSNSVALNISVISMSLGNDCRFSTCYSSYCDANQTLFASSINNAVSKKISVFAASGNEGMSKISTPSCIQNVTSVGATTKADAIASYTNTAPILDLLAPGSSIASTCMAGGFCISSGTSMATPHAAAVAAIIYQYEKLNNINATQKEVENLLKRTSVSVSGYPRINAMDSINSILILSQADNSFQNQGNDVQLRFLNSINLSSATEAFTIKNNFIDLSSAYPQFNKSANITFYNLTFEKMPVVLKNNQLCSDCRIFSYSNNALSFNISGFSNYTASSNSQLDIWDEDDSGKPYYEGKARVDNQISFYANYTNLSNQLIISAALCSISFSDLSASMLFNSTKQLFEFNRTFSSTGFKNYTINCSSSSFENLSSSNTVELLSSNLNCTYPGITEQWIINNTKVTCVNENILINSTVVQNSTLILESTNLTTSDINGFLMLNNSNLNMTSSVLSIKLKSYNSSTINSLSSSFNSPVEVYDTSSVYFDNCIFNTTFSPYHSSTTTIKNSVIANLTSQGGLSIELQNSNISSFQFGVNPSVNPLFNFTVQTNLSSASVIFRSNSTIYGYVDMPASATYQNNPIVKRYYHVQVFYTNTNIGVPNKSVNITDKSGNLVWSGTTDSNGLAIVNLSLNLTNYGSGNFTLNVNPSSDINLLTDTPITVSLSDSQAPQWTGNLTIPSSPQIYNPSASYQFIINWTDNVAISSVWIEHNFAGSFANYSAGNSGDTYFYDSGLAAGTYQFRFYANDTSGNLNKSDQWAFVINQATPTLTKLLNGQGNNLTIQYPQQINASGSASQGTLAIYNNGNSITNGQNYTLGVGNYRFDFNLTGNQNYTNVSSVLFANVTQASSICSLTFDKSSPQTTGTSINASCSCTNPEQSIFLYRDGSNATTENNQFVTLSVGTHSYICNSTSSQNYTNASLSSSFTINAASTPSSPGGGGGAPQQPENQTINSTLQTGNSNSDYSSCTENWDCTVWTSCNEGKQVRICKEYNGCGTENSKPMEEQICSSESPAPQQGNILSKIKIYLSGLKFSWLWLLILLPLVLFILFLLFRNKENVLEALIRKAQRALRNKQLDRAKKLYLKIKKLYDKLSREKQEKYASRIKAIYDDIKGLSIKWPKSSK